MQAVSRRQFLRTAGAASASALVVSPSAAWSYAANEKLRFVCIGAGGQGGAGIHSGLNEHLVAVAEVDPEGRGAGGLKQAKAKFPDLVVYTDYRKLFDAGHKPDVAWVATPDHNHFPATIRAWKRRQRLLREAAGA